MIDRDIPSELKLLESMTPEERRVLFHSEKVTSEQYYLETMLSDWKTDRSVTLKEIRQQRKQVQVWAQRLNAAKVKLDKSISSDEPSQ